MMADAAATCEVCEGKRFDAEVLDYKLGGKDISEVLAMSVAEADAFFADGESAIPAAHKIAARLVDVGLGYLTIGQPLPTLSGGERQRLKLATNMAEKGDVYVLDEPTSGLHLADVEQLLGLLDRLVDSGRSVIVIEHHQAVMAHADWIIDLGPGAGHDGGTIVFEGTPADLVAARSTLTGEHLAVVRRRLSRRAIAESRLGRLGLDGEGDQREAVDDRRDDDDDTGGGPGGAHDAEQHDGADDERRPGPPRPELGLADRPPEGDRAAEVGGAEEPVDHAHAAGLELLHGVRDRSSGRRTPR